MRCWGRCDTTSGLEDSESFIFFLLFDTPFFCLWLAGELVKIIMDTEILHASSKASHSDVGAMPRLTQVPTSVTLSAEQFEKLYLSPMMHRQSSLNKSLGNPTPL